MDGSDGTVSVQFRTEDKTAVAGSDYEQTSGELEFTDGVTEMLIQIRIIDDSVRESKQEEFFVQLFAPSGGSRLGSKTLATVTILDDDAKPGFLKFDSSSLSIVEDSGTVSLSVVRVGGNDGRVSVRWKTGDGSATSDRDYVGSTGELIFQDGQSMKTISIRIIDDQLPEPDETFNCFLFGARGGATLLAVNSIATITIIDNDRQPGVLEFKTTQITVSESSLSATVFVVRLDGSDGTVSIRYSTEDGTAVSGSDYEQTSGELEFPDGVTEKTIQIVIRDDTLRETDEHFFVKLFSPSGGAVLGSKKVATVTILDNDAKRGILQFVTSSIIVQESDQFAEIAVERIGGSDGEVTIKWMTMDRTATGSQDYTISNGLLIFGDGVTSTMIRIPILEDTIEEKTETFLVTLSDAQGGATIGVRGSITISIIDNDEQPSVIQFSKRNRSVKEAAVSIGIIVIRRGNVQRRVSVSWKTVERSAKENEDFLPSVGTLTFLPHQEINKINVTILDDDLEENNEVFDVVLFEPSKNAVLGVPSRFTVEILDDDEEPGQFAFEQVQVSVLEREQFVHLTVMRTGGTGQATVRYETKDGTAIAGRDYEQSGKELLFQPDQAFKTIVIGITDNQGTNPTRMFQVILSEPSAGNVIVDGTATVKILDDDLHYTRPSTLSFSTVSPTTESKPGGKILFSKKTVFVTENEGSVTLTVLRTVTTETETVLWRTIDITAINGMHYVAKTLNTLTFTIGELTKDFSIIINDDKQVNHPRIFKVELFTPFGMTTVDSTRNIVIVTILDDDVFTPLPQKPISVTMPPALTTIAMGQPSINPTPMPLLPRPPPIPMPYPPMPAPMPIPMPAPMPIPMPAPMPIPMPAPMPIPMPAPMPIPMPAPMPMPIPIPAPMPMPMPASRPMPIPMPAPAPIPMPAPIPIPTPMPTPAPMPLPPVPAPTPMPLPPIPAPMPPTFMPPFLTSCPSGLILKDCAAFCPPSCNDWMLKMPCMSAGLQCIKGCFCPDGLVLETQNSSKCIPRSQCGCPPGMVKVSCMSGCQSSCQRTICKRAIGGLLGGGGDTGGGLGGLGGALGGLSGALGGLGGALGGLGGSLGGLGGGSGGIGGVSGGSGDTAICISGCACPSGTVLDRPGGTVCIPKSLCSLRR